MAPADRWFIDYVFDAWRRTSILVSPEKRRMRFGAGSKFYVLIRVSFANACVSNGYKNGERFGFGDVGAPIFCLDSTGASWRLDLVNLSQNPPCGLKLTDSMLSYKWKIFG